MFLVAKAHVVWITPRRHCAVGLYFTYIDIIPDQTCLKMYKILLHLKRKTGFARFLLFFRGVFVESPDFIEIFSFCRKGFLLDCLISRHTDNGNFCLLSFVLRGWDFTTFRKIINGLCLDKHHTTVSCVCGFLLRTQPESAYYGGGSEVERNQKAVVMTGYANPKGSPPPGFWGQR